MPVLRTCPACGTANRIPAKHVSDTGRCGKCKSPLAPSSEPIEVDTVLFDEIVRDSTVPVLVDLWAAWCGPCRMAAPEVEAVAREMAGRAVVLKVDTERYPDIAARYQVQGIPTFLVFSKGRLVVQRAGVTPRAEMRRWLEQSGTSAA